MSDAKSNYLEVKILDHVLSTTSYTMPANVYVALHTANPTDAGGGAEVAGGSYARLQCDFAGAATVGGVTTAESDDDLEFEDLPTATITHIGIWDASTSGNLLYYGPLTASKSVTAGDSLSFAAGQITVEEQ